MERFEVVEKFGSKLDLNLIEATKGKREPPFLENPIMKKKSEKIISKNDYTAPSWVFRPIVKVFFNVIFLLFSLFLWFPFLLWSLVCSF